MTPLATTFGKIRNAVIYVLRRQRITVAILENTCSEVLKIECNQYLN